MTPQDNLARYLRDIYKFPMLSAQEEVELARRWRNNQDGEAAHKLATSHLRLVARIAMSYRGYGLPLGDLISEGNIGMLQALKRYCPERGFRFATYAMWWVRAEIQVYVLHSWSLVKIGATAAQKKLFFNLRRLKQQLHAIEAGDLPPDQLDQIAERLDVPQREVVSMNQRLAALDQSLSAPIAPDSEAEWLDGLADEQRGSGERPGGARGTRYAQEVTRWCLKSSQ